MFHLTPLEASTESIVNPLPVDKEPIYIRISGGDPSIETILTNQVDLFSWTVVITRMTYCYLTYRLPGKVGNVGFRSLRRRRDFGWCALGRLAC